jgi:hypothetical protein
MMENTSIITEQGQSYSADRKIRLDTRHEERKQRIGG